MAARRATRDQRGLSFVEVLVAALVVGIAGVGVAVMFSTGQTYVNAEGDNRVALYLAQQRIEQVRALGYSSLFPPGTPSDATEAVPNHPGYTRRIVINCVPRDDYAAPSETCDKGTSALSLIVTVCSRPQVSPPCALPASPVDGKSPPVEVSSILAPR